MREKGKLIVISGPSGAGKSTVVFKAIEGRDDVCFSTSVTTRKPRPNETDGKEYFFVDLDRFREMVENDELLEHAEYAANSYGTPRAYVEKQLKSGMNVLLDILASAAGSLTNPLKLSKTFQSKRGVPFSERIVARYCKYLANAFANTKVFIEYYKLQLKKYKKYFTNFDFCF